MIKHLQIGASFEISLSVAMTAILYIIGVYRACALFHSFPNRQIWQEIKSYIINILYLLSFNSSIMASLSFKLESRRVICVFKLYIWFFNSLMVSFLFSTSDCTLFNCEASSASPMLLCAFPSTATAAR